MTQNERVNNIPIEVPLANGNLSNSKVPQDAVDSSEFLVKEQPQEPEQEILVAIRTMLDERDKAMPSIIRNEVMKMLEEAKRAQLGNPTGIAVNPAISMPALPPPDQPQNSMGGLAQALPAILQMLGSGGSNDMSNMLMAKVVEAGLNNMTLGSRFLDAIVTTTMKNVGVTMANQTSAQMLPKPLG